MKTPPTTRRPLKPLALAIGLLLLAAAPARAADTDLDGLPDAWEIEHFGNLTASDGTGDFDRDGRTDAEELADTTDPTNPGSTLGLVAYYPFDGNANDASGNGHDGTVHGASLSTNRFGEPNAAFAFDGLANEIDVVETPGFEQNSFTLSVWMKADRFNPPGKVRCEVVGKGFSFQWVLQLEQSGKVRNAIFTSNGETTFDSVNTITTNAWYHIAKVWDGSTSSTYINGVFDSSRPAGGTLVPGDDPVVMGGWSNFNQRFQGDLDDIRLYTRALSSNEVARLYGAEPQPATHLVALHPGDHGDIPGANSGADYVTNVTHGAAFTPPTPVPDAVWTFTGWDPAIPATITNDVTATAGYVDHGTMVTIEGGTNSGTDPESGAYSLTVETFQIGQFEVTKDLWDSVRSWAVTNGYTDLPTGASKRGDYPIHNVNWYAVAKWCNARSEMEGLAPCYRVSGIVYRAADYGSAGSSVVECDFSANGYRLPRGVEWEYAARGGAVGQRFPWGDTISHTQANYRSSATYAYDLSPTRDYHPIYATGGTPYTSPVGAFAPNANGLHDMIGNVWEWIWDFSSTDRQQRGGSWMNYVDYSRCSGWGSGRPHDGQNYIGFRVARTSIADTDLDGLPDAWESEHFGNLTSSDGTGDFDRDGRTDAEELADNTEPTDPGSTLGLVAYYPLDGDADDATTNTYDAATSNLLYVVNRYGESGMAAGLNGSSSSVTMTNSILNLGQSAYTISLWFNTANISQRSQCLFNSNPHAGIGFVYNHNDSPSRLSAYIGNGSGWQLSRQRGSKTDYVNNEWYHVVFVKNGNQYSFSVNAVVDYQTTHSGASAYNLNIPLVFGRTAHYSEYLNGSLDDIRIYSRALSATEVARLYTATSQPTTHLVTLHPGDHGDIPGAPSGADYVTNVAHGAAFTPPTPVADAGWSFTGWNPAIPATITNDFVATAGYEAVALPDLSLAASDFRILNAAGAETANPAIGEAVTLEVTLRNTGDAATTGDILVQAFLDGAPTDLTAYDVNAFSNVASTVVAESLSVGGSRTLLLPWTVTGPDRMATLTVVAEFSANRAQSQANAEGASAALPAAEASFANNSVGRSLQIGSPAGDFGIEVLSAPPPNMQSGVGYTLAGTARYDWGTRAPVLGATVTVTLSNQTHTARTASPNGAWSVALNGLPAGSHPALVQVFDGRLTGETNLTLVVSAGAETRDLRILDFGFEIGTYRVEGQTGYAVTGSDVVVRARVRNDGNAASGDFVVAFRDGTDATYATYATNLPAFAERWITAPAGWAAQAGPHTLRAVVDSAGAVTESNEGNNSRSCMVVGTAARPDLLVTALAFDPAGPKAGDTVTVTATVRNQGGAAVAAGTTFEVSFAVDGATVAAGTAAPLDGLAAGASMTVAATYTFAAAGAFTVSAQADSGGAVTETAEDNNAGSATLAVRKALPDLRPWTLRWGWQQVSGLSFSPAQPSAGEAVTVSCDLYNVGTVPLAAGRPFDVVFSAGGAVFATNRVTLAAELAVGASVRASAVWPGGAAGVTSFTVAVDTEDECEEENEGNNVTSAGLTVYPAGAALVAAGLTTSPLQPLPGSAVILNATIRNDGGAAGGAGALVEFFAGTTNLVDRIGVTNLAADAAAKGGTQVASLAWTAPGTAGPVTLYARVGGSAAQRVMTVTPNPAPNLQVYSEDIVFDPALPTNGATVAVSAAVRNTEGSAATGFQVRFFVDTPLGGWRDLGGPVTVGSLAVGAETIVTATDAILADRSAFGVKVELVPNAAQGDADAGDNAATSSFVLAETPAADAGADAACIVGQSVALDGAASRNATTYAWTLVERPVGSLAELAGASTARPTLTPDRPGRYRARLVVGDGLLASEPDTVALTARWLTLEVVSAHGTTVPAVGVHPFPWLTVVDCQSTSVESVDPGTRYLCAGWSGTGSAAPHGAATNCSFAITNDSTLVWNWRTEHWLTVGSDGGTGWLSVTGTWYAAGYTAAVAAVAADGYRFDRWQVDGVRPPEGGTTNGTNTVAVVMGVPHVLTAVFAALGLPEALDNTSLVWTTGGASNWVAQTRQTFDGADAAGSGVVSNNAQSWLETTVETGGTLTFVWRTSSKELSGLLRFEVDGQTRGLLSGETGWRTVSVTVPYGPHTFRWTYARGKGGAEGADRGWVDQAVWTPLPPLTLAVALDATNLTWATEGDAAWFPQTAVTADGVAAAQSGAVGDLGLSCLTARVRGPGVLAFDWRVSCEERYDWLMLVVDGDVEWAVTGESGWQSVQLALGTGDHELRWEYWKDESASEGLDAGWLDRVSWSGGVPPQAGFAFWLAERGLGGDAAALFGQDRNGDGVPNGFEYAFGTNAPAGPLLGIRVANGRPVVETPAPDAASAPYVEVRVLGSTNLTDWTLPVVPAADITGKPAGRAWHEPAGVRPGKAFFKLEAGLKLGDD